MERRIAFTGKCQVEMENFELKAPGKGELRVKTLVSLMSTGTENIVFNRNFDPGTGWDNWVKYPFYPGYTSCGVVEAVGEEVKSFKVGDRVVMRCGHASAHIVGEGSCVKVPAGVPDESAAWFGLAKIGAMGARVSNLALGSTVAIVGAGPIGQMALRWCACAGSFPVVSIDAVQMRIDLALKGGASHAIAKPFGEAVAEMKEIFGGDAPETIIDSTGHYKVFQDILRASRKFGRVVLLGDTGSPENQHLTQDLIGKGIALVGAHDCNETPEWNTQKITKLFFHLVASGRFNLDGMNTHRFAPEGFADAYKTANERRGETMGIYFDWK